LSRLPVLVWVIVAIAFVHGAAWAVLTPSFQGADEIVQMGYVEYVAENGVPPSRIVHDTQYPKDLGEALKAIPWSTTADPSWSEGRWNRLQHVLDRIDDRPQNRTDPDAAGYQSNNPPLYAYLMAVPYHVAGWLGGDILDRMTAVRLATSLLGAVSVLFVLLFLRELLPRRRLAWYAGGLAMALQPVFGWLIGSVNNDVPVVVAGAGLLWLVARAFRRGLTVKLAIALGVVVAVGLLAKVSAYGLGAALAWSLLVLVLRDRARWRTVVPLAVLALAVAVVPLAVVAEIRNAQASDFVASTGAAAPAPRSPRDLIAYVWQFWLPKLPFMDEQFPGYPHYPVWQTYIQGFAGRFGWFQYGFSPNASRTMVWVLGGIVTLGGVTAARSRRAVRRNLPLLVALIGSGIGFALMVNIAGWGYRIDSGANFEQTRYLFPMLGLYAAAVGAAVLAFPARWRPGAVAVVAVTASLHVIAAWALTLLRYYA
jgi:4-amino-4-deoxy-L-arabinose transferase-like glycosyltransferase